MRWAIPASLGVHVGLIAAAWIAMQWRPEELSVAEAAVSIDIVAMEDAVTEPSQTISEATANLVSAGATSMVEADTAEAVEEIEAAEQQPVQANAAIVPVTEALTPTETDELVSAEVMTALAEVEAPVAAPIPQVTDDAAPTVAETVAPSDAQILEHFDNVARLSEFEPTQEVQQITTASITPVTPAEPVKVANLTPILEEVVEETNTPPVPLPRPVRKPVEVEAEKQPADKPRKKAAEKPVETPKPKQVASVGSGGSDEADSAAAKAAGGSKGKTVGVGQGTIDAYQGKVRAKLLKAVRTPRGSDGGEARVMFTLDANGRVLSARLSKSSGDDKLDQAAFAAVERGAPYPAIPEGAGKSTWSFTIPIAVN